MALILGKIKYKHKKVRVLQLSHSTWVFSLNCRDSMRTLRFDNIALLMCHVDSCAYCSGLK